MKLWHLLVSTVVEKLQLGLWLPLVSTVVEKLHLGNTQSPASLSQTQDAKSVNCEKIDNIKTL